MFPSQCKTASGKRHALLVLRIDGAPRSIARANALQEATALANTPKSDRDQWLRPSIAPPVAS